MCSLFTVIEAGEEAEVVDVRFVRSAMEHCKSKMWLSVSPLSTLEIYRAAAADVHVKKPKQSWQTVYTAVGTALGRT